MAAQQNSNGRSVAVRYSGVASIDVELTRHMDGQQGCQFLTFAAKDDDELNEALCAGQFCEVVYGDADSLLEALWKGHANYSRWKQAGVEVRILRKADGDLLKVMPEIHGSIERWRVKNRRRQVVAAVILSGITLAGMSALFALLGPAR